MKFGSVLVVFGLAAASFAQDALPRRGMLGLPLAQVGEDARKAAGLGDAFGILISDEPKQGNQGELKKGDVIVEVGGRTFQSVAQFNEALRPALAKSETEVAFIRSGQKLKTTVKVLPKPADEGPNHTTIYDHVVSNGTRIRTFVTKPKNLEGRRPVLFWIQGINASTVEAPLGANNYITNVLRPFSDEGWVTVRVEKEGVGDSEGRPALLVDFLSEVDIYRQALKKLDSYDFVDRDRVYVFGHSMGGCHAPIVCSEFPVKGIATWGTVSMSWLEWQVRSPRIQGPLGGTPESEIDKQVRQDTAFYHFLYNERRSIDWIVENRPELAEAARAQSPDGVMLGIRSIEYMRQCNDQNYAAHWEKVPNGKVIAFFGADDFIALKEDQTQVAAIVNRVRPGAAEYREVPGTDHLFRKTESFQDSYDKLGGKPSEFNPVVVEELKKWIESVEKGSI